MAILGIYVKFRGGRVLKIASFRGVFGYLGCFFLLFQATNPWKSKKTLEIVVEGIVVGNPGCCRVSHTNPHGCQPVVIGFCKGNKSILLGGSSQDL